MAFLAGGCAAPYQKREGFASRGGYSDQLLGNDTARISFEGNAYTSSWNVHRYVERRCAEFTLEQGFDYFEILDGKTEKHAVLGTKSNGLAYSAWAIVKLFKGNKPDRTNVASAREQMNGVFSESDLTRIPKLNGQ